MKMPSMMYCRQKYVNDNAVDISVVDESNFDKTILDQKYQRLQIFFFKTFA